MLLNKFGQEYMEYRKSVPVFFPTIFSFKGGQKWGPSIKRYFRSQEYKLFIWIIILVIVFHIKEELFVEKESFDMKIVFLMITAFLLGAIDLAGEIIHKILGNR
jgi:hypothetical protein